MTEPTAPAPLIVAIDGTSGVGKSTVAGRVAERLGVPTLDTGATYRAVALEVLERDTDLEDRDAVLAAAAAAELELRPEPDGGGFEVLLAGEPVGQRIRTPRVTDATSRVSVHPEIRQRLVTVQRRTAERYGAVVEGRDIGSVVFPNTPYKFFLHARPEVRAARRHAELVAAGEGTELAEVLRDIEARDARDSGREASPLVFDASYHAIDTSDLTIAEVVDRMVAEIERRRAPERPTEA
ncbi:MAG: (d)CMP kinase [Acidobacteriota bacterium]